jgi:hypothetical protein
MNGIYLTRLKSFHWKPPFKADEISDCYRNTPVAICPKTVAIAVSSLYVSSLSWELRRKRWSTRD